MSSLYVYIEALLETRHERRTGIPRVELELARELVARGAVLITYSMRHSRFVTIDFEKVIRPIIRAQDGCLDGVLDAGTHVPATSAGTGVRRLLGFASGAIGGRAGIELFAIAAPALKASERRQIAERLGLFENPRLAITFLDRMAGYRSTTFWPLSATKVAQFQPGDVIFVPSIVWRHDPLNVLAELKRMNGVRVISFIHDLIPLRRPEYFTDDGGIERYRRYVDALVKTSDWFCTSSDFVANDLRKYMSETGNKAVPVRKMPLCAAITPATPPQATGRLEALRLPQNGYALYVSTFNPRKNQQGIYLLWKRLAETMGELVPPLVLAGQAGWHSGDILRQIARTNAAGDRSVLYVEAPTDGELAELYRNCAFTVFPSHYEGWGLSITESLAFGKPCISADNTSMREASQGLATHIDNLDGMAWLAAMQDLAQNKVRRREIAERIQREFKPRTWRDVGDDLMEIVSSLDERRT